MTQPVQIAFVFENDKPKIFLRTLLYATGKRGYIIEGLYLTIQQGQALHTFGFWGYGQRNELMVAGGLRVTEEGVAYNHHFLDINENSTFDYAEGEYFVSVFARIVNHRRPKILATVKLALPNAEASLLRFKRTTGLLYTWDPYKNTYHPSLQEQALKGTAPAST